MKIARVLTVVAGAAAVLVLGTAPVANAQTQTVRFEHTGEAQSFTVPAGVTEIEMEACGAEGGIGADLPTAAGLGAMVVASRTVQPGETLAVLVGGQGGDGSALDADGVAPGGAGGFNGGGEGGAADGSDDLRSGGGGGGASDVRQAGTDLANRVLVAGGGGGSGAWSDGDDDFPAGPPGTGGAGGTDEGLPGGNDHGGTGGTQSAGGLGGTGDYDDGVDGDLGIGGAGGAGTAINSRGGGGAGGGNYGGGGGGSADLSAGGGGGGGSSLNPGGVVTDGACTGDGYVEITFVVPPGPPTPPTPAPAEVLRARVAFTG